MLVLLATTFLPILLVVLAAAGKAFILTWLLGGGFGTFVVLFIIFKMLGR